RLEFDFIVTPGSDPGLIRLRFAGANQVRLDHAGNLVLQVPGGDVVQPAPIVYQKTGDQRQSVTGRFVLLGGNDVGFQVGPYDSYKELFIDPVLDYSSYLGGSGDDEATAVALGPDGSLFLAGTTGSVDFPGAGQSQLTGSTDAFISKLDPSGTAIAYTAFV